MLLDPFINPAKGALIDESVLLGTPTFYGISNQNGAGRSPPFTALFRSDRGFGAISFALQQLVTGQRRDIIFFATDVIWPEPRLRDLSATNLYVSGSIGTELGESGFSVGAGASWAGLDAVDGVEHLYAGPATFGIDVVFEPIWSDTWAEAAADTVSVNEQVIRKGDKTVENDFSSFGAKTKFSEFEIGYQGRLTTGSGRPGVQWTGGEPRRC